MNGLDIFFEALTLRAGYNSALVAIGAALLGIAGGGAGAFIFLRKRALVSDAVSHATLPGIAIAFIVMAALGGTGRWMPGLLAGSAISAAAGLLIVEWMARRTRLSEDAAIGAVLSVFFGLGIVLLTVIQTSSSGQQAGLGSFLLGSTAGMLISEAYTIAAAGAVAAILVFAMRKPMTLVAFDPDFASANGFNVRLTDIAILTLSLIVTVIGLKVVGLILIVALLIIPPVAARFWTDRVDWLILISAGIGGAAGYLGAAASSAFEGFPTGPVIVLVAFFLFLGSLLLSPLRGALASALRHWQFRRRVHERQGLLALARNEPILDGLTLSVLRRAGSIRRDGVATLSGRAAAAKALQDEARWAEALRGKTDNPILEQYDGLTPIEDLLTADQIAELDRRLARLEAAT
ncbi:MAG: iron chelate uptake ABC transporter family permease subunit [Pseudomonadota bacterium]